MKTYRLNSIVLGTALVLTDAGIGRAEPSPHLMNSMHRLHVEARKNAKADVAAGQSSVAVPDLSHRVVAEGTLGDFKVAPLLQLNPTPEAK